MHSAKPGSPTRPTNSAHWREVARIGGVIIVAALAAGALVADLEIAVVLILGGGWLVQALAARRLRRLDAEHAAHGLDPQVIAAARRISRRLARRNQHDQSL